VKYVKERTAKGDEVAMHGIFIAGILLWQKA